MGASPAEPISRAICLEQVFGAELKLDGKKQAINVQIYIHLPARYYLRGTFVNKIISKWQIGTLNLHVKYRIHR